MFNKKYFKGFFWIVIMCSLSCKNHSHTLSPQYIRKISQVSLNSPSDYGFLLVFVKVDNETMGITNLNVLHDFYTKYSKSTYRTYEFFLDDALNGNILIKKDKIRTGAVYFNIDDSIQKLYTLSKAEFLKNSSKLVKNYLIVKQKNGLTNNQFYTTLYFYFINSYELYRNDMGGEYIAHKY